mmetsp:Transcript_28713/g.67330  ORF Transcript_28713/g.67330 Transcript_28713/m.67330 type:complete len:210 (-) Transcript_28713:412-1041(-)
MRAPRLASRRLVSLPCPAGTGRRTEGASCAPPRRTGKQICHCRPPQWPHCHRKIGESAHPHSSSLALLPLALPFFFLLGFFFGDACASPPPSLASTGAAGGAPGTGGGGGGLLPPWSAVSAAFSFSAFSLASFRSFASRFTSASRVTCRSYQWCMFLGFFLSRSSLGHVSWFFLASVKESRPTDAKDHCESSGSISLLNTRLSRNFFGF